MPRPIAWISTQDVAGKPNLAPFSFFNVASRFPPTLAISIGQPSDKNKEKKDTLYNIEQTGQLVINVVTESLVDQMNISGMEFPREVDEFSAAGLHYETSTMVLPPRVAEAKVSMECISRNVIPIGPDHLVLAEVVAIRVSDDVLENNKINPQKLKAVGRMAGPNYCTTERIFELKIPPLEGMK